MNNEKKEVIQRSMLDWYGTIAHFVDRFRRAIMAHGLTDIDMDGWMLSYDTGWPSSRTPPQYKVRAYHRQKKGRPITRKTSRVCSQDVERVKNAATVNLCPHSMIASGERGKSVFRGRDSLRLSTAVIQQKGAVETPRMSKIRFVLKKCPPTGVSLIVGLECDGGWPTTEIASWQEGE